MYAALVLDQRSKEMLRDYVMPQFETTYCHHVTLKFPCTEEEFKGVLATYQPYAEVQDIFIDDFIGVQAATVTVFGHQMEPHTHQNSGTRMHVTVSCKAPVKPVMAKHILHEGSNGECLGLHGEIVLVP